MQPRHFVLKESIDATDKHSINADALFICLDRRVDRYQLNITTACSQRADERVVSQATTAVHPGSTGSDVDDLQITISR